MPLQLDEVVVVNIAVAPTAVALQSFGSLIFMTPDCAPLNKKERSRGYADIVALGTDHKNNPEVMAAGTAYYSQTPTPRDFRVGYMSKTATKATYTGVPSANLIGLKAVTAGGLTMAINDTPVVLPAVDLSAEATLVAVATKLQGLLSAVVTGTTVTHDGSAFVITAPVRTDNKPATVATATAQVQDLAALLGWSNEQGGTLDIGETVETIAQALMLQADFDNSFYGVAFDRKFRDTAQVLAAHDWCKAAKKVFFNTSNAKSAKVLGDKSNVGAKLKAAAASAAITLYSSTPAQYPCCSVAGRAFTVNFEGTNTTITLNLKQGPTITAENLTSSEFKALKEKNMNAFVTISSTNVFSDSHMGDGGWLDTVHGVAWLQNRIQTDVFNLLFSTTTKIPYTDAGVGKIVQRVEQGLRQGVTNGLIAPGFLEDGTYLIHGYEITAIPVGSVSSADKSNRIYNGITFRACGAGAIHNVTINGSFTN